jgi:serine/threonine-protein kinase
MGPPRVVGRYLVAAEIAAGGMASVHFGRMLGPAGFARTVAIKRLHRHLVAIPELMAMFIDEARLASRIAHPNVVSTLDIVDDAGEMLLVMDYVHGASLSSLVERALASGEGPHAIPVEVAVAIIAGALEGLHAAHEARSEQGQLLGVVHRDVSPQNILVGADGVPRVVDFGIAKAVGRLQNTRDGEVKGKVAYMAPEQIRSEKVDRRADVYAASVVLWELLAGQRLFLRDHPMATMNAVFDAPVPRLSDVRAEVTPELADVVAWGLSRVQETRYPTARAMAIALEAAIQPATAREVSEWVQTEAAELLAERARATAALERYNGSEKPLTDRSTMGAMATELTVATGATEANRRGRGLAWLGVGAALLAGSVGILLYVRSQPTAVSAASAGTPLASTGASASLVPSAVALPDASASTSASAVLDASPSAEVVTGTAPRDRQPRTRGHLPSRPHPATRTCDPPYTVDPDGTRHWKDGC